MPRRDAFATKLLFICSRNRMRSLTAEKIFSGIPGYEVRSAGTQPQARIVVNEGHLRWADIIFVMEKAHLNRLRLVERDETSAERGADDADPELRLDGKLRARRAVRHVH